MPDDWLNCLFPVLDPASHTFYWNNTGRIVVRQPLRDDDWTNGESRLVATARWVGWSERECV